MFTNIYRMTDSSQILTSQLWDSSYVGSQATVMTHDPNNIMMVCLSRGDVGLGMKILSKNSMDGQPNGVFIQELRRGGPAEVCGLREGDIFLEVNGCDLEGCSSNFASELFLRFGGEMKIKIFRPSQPDLNKTLSLEDLILGLEKEEHRSPMDEEKLNAYKSAKLMRAEYNMTTRDAVALFPALSHF